MMLHLQIKICTVKYKKMNQNSPEYIQSCFFHTGISSDLFYSKRQINLLFTINEQTVIWSILKEGITLTDAHIRNFNEKYMLRAIWLAKKGEGYVSPNPLVGAVIVKDGRIIGEGWHECCGGLHAERQAFAHCTEPPEGADLYVTLEPCCHYGRTPPCTEAVISHGIRRVFTGSDDPNPLVAGKGIQILRNHGIEVYTHVCKDACDRLNEVFFYYIRHKEPFVVMKYAMTIDGKIATGAGFSKWITGAVAREKVHRDRHKYRGIMAGIGTVLKDDPLLNCRMPGGRDPVRIICDSRLRIPLDSQIVKTARKIPSYIACTQPPSDLKKIKYLTDAGCQVILCGSRNEKVDLKRLMQLLGDRSLRAGQIFWRTAQTDEPVDSILMEGGAELNYSALQSGIVNKVQAYVAPKIFGGTTAKSPVGGQGVMTPDEAFRLKNLEIIHLAGDLLIEGQVE